MDDSISRQGALDAIDTIGHIATMPDGDKCIRRSAVKYTLSMLPPAEPEQRWIPCSERLPEEKDAGILKKLGINTRSDDVIATVDVKGERMTVTACTYDGKWDWNMKYAFPDFKVVAWMPLPEPYQEDNNG